MGKSQSFSFDHIKDPYSEQDAFGSESRRSEKSFLVIGPLGILLGILLIGVLCLATGLIVYFLHPNHSLTCDETTPSGGNVTWEVCVNMARQRDECLSFGSCPIGAPKLKTTTATEESSTNQPIISIDSMTSEEPATSSEAPINLSLPSNLKPLHYNIEIKPDLYTNSTVDFSYTGHVRIFLYCQEPTNIVYIHCTMMAIDNSTVEVRYANDSLIAIQSQSEDPTREFYVIELETTLSEGDEISVWIAFAGPIIRDMSGMYWRSYVDNNGTVKYMLASQFEATDARTAFPCLDEPHLKATFNITLWRKKPMIALSNMPIYNSEVVGDWIRESFEKTSVVMSTYLVAFIVAEFDYVERLTPGGPNIRNEKQIRIYTQPAFIEAGFADYAANISVPMFDYFEEYFNESYPFPKTDQITIPDFSAGAMENWGLITYRESRLLVDPGYTSLFDKWRFTRTIAHELLHQWLGNFVTCDWWGDLWLQEGAARYFEHKAVQDAQPEWNVAHTYQAYALHRALAADQTGSSHPVYNPGITQYSEIEGMFSVITYDKGSTIYRLIEQVLFRGHQQAFDQAMRDYLQQNGLSVANHDDLLSVFDVAAQAAGIDVNVTDVIYTWIKQMGYPVVTLTLKENRTSVDVTQKMFLIDPEKPLKESYSSEFNYTWEIPFSYITSVSDTPTYEWMHKGPINISLESPLPEDGWIVGNYQQLGFYRVNYDESNWEALIRQLLRNHQAIDVLHRTQILEDSLNLARAGDVDQVTALRATEYLVNETEWLPWHAASRALQYFDVITSTTPEYGDFEQYMRYLVDSNYNSLGWERKEKFLDIFSQVLTLRLACKYGTVDCISRSLALFEDWKSDPTNLTIIETDFRKVVYDSAIEHSVTSDDWLFLFDQYQKVYHEQERAIMRDALARSSEPWILQKYFDMAASQDSRIHFTDWTSVMQSVARNYPTGAMVAHEYIDQNWQDMSTAKFSVLESITARYSTEFHLGKLENFIMRHPPTSISDAKRYRDLMYSVKANVRWRKRNGEKVAKWLAEAVQRQTN